MNAPIIDTPDFTLRPFQASDASAVASGIVEWDVIRMLTTPPYPFELHDAETYIAQNADTPWMWVIDIEGTAAGSVGIVRHLGYWLSKLHWGRGVMTRAAGLAVDAFFQRDDRDHIDSGYLFDNPASERVLTKIGFKKTGRSMPRANSRGGEVLHIDMVLSRADWGRRRAE
ncbi:MAG: GNAT family N-acetyltransferase [Pseudomonadota bacterium]